MIALRKCSTSMSHGCDVMSRREVESISVTLQHPSPHIIMSSSHRRVRMNCAAAAYSNLSVPICFAGSLFNLPFVTVFA